jgi:hypothetical protein
LKEPSSIDGGAGEWPDPLIPRIDRYYQQRRNGFPFTLSAGRSQPVWCELYVPSATPPGTYSGRVVVTIDSQRQVTVPVEVVVWNFVLPSTSSIATSFGLNGVAALREHRGEYTSDDDLYDLSYTYQKAALLHRISTHGGSMAPPQIATENGRPAIDWSAYDKEVGPFLDGQVLTRNDALPGARATSIELRMHNAMESDEQKIWYYRQFAAHFRERGWFDRLFHYVWDEPRPEDAAAVLRRARLARAADPDLRNLVTARFYEDWSPAIDIWVPLMNCFEKRPGFSEFCDRSVERTAYADEVAKGKQLWWYQSCASHSCSGAGGEYFRGWPSYMIDTGGVANRVMPWIAWKYNIRGELYFNLNEGYRRDRDPWQDVYLFGGNGDGTLIYPGRPDKVGGTTHIPIESIRLKLIREGLEDYEYLKKLGEAGELVDAIVRKAYDFDRDPLKLYAVRQQMGERLTRGM